MRCTSKLFITLTLLTMTSNHSYADDLINKNYIRSLASPEKYVAVIEYTDANGKVIERKGFASSKGWKAVSPTEFLLAKGVKMNLFGVTPCQGQLVNKRENFSGSCDDYATQHLQIWIKNPKVLLCRSYMHEKNAPSQNTTCYGWYYLPGALDSVDNLEDQLVGVGALKVATKPDSTPLRPDLLPAQKTSQVGMGGLGMWEDPNHKIK